MRYLAAIAMGLPLLAVGVSPVAAHSLKSLENQLRGKEKYFQPLDRQAPDFSLRDAEGRTVALRDFRGKAVVLQFVYTNCPDVCPLHAERIAKIQEMIGPTPMRDLVQFVTITTDPKRDTPEVMCKYGEAHGLAPVNWIFLTSGPDRLSDTRRLVEKFGHKFTKVDNGYQIHGVVTHVIDGGGRWRANFHGLEFNPTNLVLFINALTNDAHDENSKETKGLWDKFRALF